MEKRRFREQMPGSLCEIESHGGWSFIPEPLPPAWTIPAEIWPLLSKTKQKLGELEGIGWALRNPMILLAPLRNREAIDSSTIEGTYATPEELLLLEFDKDAGHGTAAYEVANYAKAFGQSLESELNFETIREMHRTLLTGTPAESKGPGKVRDVQVAVGKSARFVPPPPDQLADLIADFDRFLQSGEHSDPLVDAFLSHYQFETIHPFADGNGRVGRAFLSLTIFQRCGFSKPWLYLSGYFEKHRQQYIDRLFAVSTHADWTSWVEFCLQATLSQASNTITQCQQLVHLQEAFEQRVADAGGSFRLQQILTLLFERQFLQVARLPEILEVSYPTASSDLKRLVEAGILAELQNYEPRTYFSPELFKLTYGRELK